MGVVILAVLWKPIFGDWDGFRASFQHYCQSNLSAAVNRNYTRDWKTALKLWLWLAPGIAAGFAVHAVLERAMGG